MQDGEKHSARANPPKSALAGCCNSFAPPSCITPNDYVQERGLVAVRLTALLATMADAGSTFVSGINLDGGKSASPYVAHLHGDIVSMHMNSNALSTRKLTSHPVIALHVLLRHLSDKIKIMPPKVSGPAKQTATIL